jgi:hypothetical protein
MLAYLRLLPIFSRMIQEFDSLRYQIDNFELTEVVGGEILLSCATPKLNS